MRRGTGIALTASALSITLGVLVGAVITIGTDSRTNSARPGVAASSAQISTDPVASSLGPLPISQAPAAMSTVGTVTVSPAPVSVPAPSLSPVVTASATPRTTARPTHGTNTSRKPVPTLVYTTVNVAPDTTAIPPPGAPAAQGTGGNHGGPGAVVVAGALCPQLGQKGTVAQGWNVFCQRDFRLGTLTWRPVVDGGGCLSKRMTGVGVDGQQYVCRADGARLDRWRRAA